MIDDHRALGLKRRHWICADDWGLTPGINRGILNLARSGMVHGVSLMANGPYLEEELESLRAVPGIELGIHFNLSYGRPLLRNVDPTLLQKNGSGNWVSLRDLLRTWLLAGTKKRNLLIQSVCSEFEAQILKLKSVGVACTFLNGHHHVHLLPGILDGLRDVLKKESIGYVRNPWDPGLLFSKQCPILGLSLLARRTLKNIEFQSMPFFYPRNWHFRNPSLLLKELSHRSRSEIIVHPASKNDLGILNDPDSYTHQRVEEYLCLQAVGVLLEGAKKIPAPLSQAEPGSVQ